MEVLIAGPLVEFLRRHTGRGDETHRDRAPHAVDDIDVALVVGRNDPRCGVTVLGVDVVDVGVRSLRDMGVRRNDRMIDAHRALLGTRGIHGYPQT
jgi:hypothetical protein